MRLPAAFAVVLSLAPCLAQESRRADNPELVRRLQELLAPVGVTVERQAISRVPASQQIRGKWVQPPAAAGLAGPPALPVTGRRHNAGSIPRLRSLDLSPDVFLVAALDSQSRLRGWTLLRDPRTVRAEFPGPDGVLTGRSIPVPSPEWLIDIPDDPAVTEIRIYQPSWTGQRFHLVPVGQAGLK